jgi:hypothetical protein
MQDTKEVVKPVCLSFVEQLLFVRLREEALPLTAKEDMFDDQALQVRKGEIANDLTQSQRLPTMNATFCSSDPQLQ